MKNVQVIDGAENCAYDVFAFTDDEFSIIFPAFGQNIEFIEDVIIRIGEEEAGSVLRNVWNRRVDKTKLEGLHGILFYELLNKKKYYPTKKEDEMEDNPA